MTKRKALPLIRSILRDAIKLVDSLEETASGKKISDLIGTIEFADACAKQLEVRAGKVVGVNPNNGEIT